MEFVRESRVSMGWCAASEGWLASAAHLLTRESIEWVVVVAVGRHLSVVCRQSFENEDGKLPRNGPFAPLFLPQGEG